jgi:hypothetical protein
LILITYHDIPAFNILRNEENEQKEKKRKIPSPEKKKIDSTT